METAERRGLENDSMEPFNLGFIGAGQMATALAAGVVRAEIVGPQQIWAGDPDAGARERFATRLAGAHVESDNRQVVSHCRILVLAVKPTSAQAVLAELAPTMGPQHLLISICAGVPLARLASGLPDGVRLIRVMPNTPSLVGEGASGYALGPTATEEDARLAERLLGAVGTAYRLDERLLDAVTGLAGSGPAFVYLLIEALSDGGVRMGLPRPVAAALAAQTLRGAATMVLQTGEHPAVLRERVTSPGGTTAAGLAALEQCAVRSAMMRAVESATQRSIELGNA